MNLRTLYATKNECYIQGVKITPVGFMLHSTGANNPNLRRYVGPDDGLLGVNLNNNHYNIYHPEGKDIGPHKYIDNGKSRCTICGGRQIAINGFIGLLGDGKTVATYNTIPWDMASWHSGRGAKGAANTMGYIGVEICEDGLTDPVYFAAVYKEAVEVIAYLAKLYKWDVDKPTKYGTPVIVDHTAGAKLGIASNHADVSHWFPMHGKSIDTVRSDVNALLAAPAKKKIYHVQVGAFKNKAGAITFRDDMRKKYPDAFLVGPAADGLYRVQVGAFGVKENADRYLADVKSKGLAAFLVVE
ncbi:hypothetical protein FACS1894191_8640 [Clostridia bacterium]|nr:hypothetical protein FACS1894191_8640 [Clostridia bacterium]